ncbi:MAG: hypothetical protein GY794_13295 [bacterium]|nr:hypothetical protein [bacterium]
MVRTIREMCFDESAVAMIAIGALKDEVGRKPKEVIKDFEARLDKTKTLGLRNAIRLTLKDLYAETDNKDKMIEHLNALVVENDKALNKKK